MPELSRRQKRRENHAPQHVNSIANQGAPPAMVERHRVYEPGQPSALWSKRPAG